MEVVPLALAGTRSPSNASCRSNRHCDVSAMCVVSSLGTDARRSLCRHARLQLFEPVETTYGGLLKQLDKQVRTSGSLRRISSTSALNLQRLCAESPAPLPPPINHRRTFALVRQLFDTPRDRPESSLRRPVPMPLIDCATWLGPFEPFIRPAFVEAGNWRATWPSRDDSS